MHNEKRKDPSMMNMDKAKDFKGTIKKLIKYLSPYKYLVIISIVLGMMSASLVIIAQDKISNITDLIKSGFMTGIDMDKIKHLTIMLIIIFVLSFAFDYIQAFLMAIVNNNLTKDLRSRMSDKINKLPLKYFDNNKYGDILSRFTNDIETIGHTLHQSIDSLITSITLFIGVLLMMFITNYVMAITAIVSSVLGFLLLTLILSKSQKYFIKQQNELGKINAHIEEIYSSHNVVKVYNAIDKSNEKFDSINHELYKSSKKSQFISGLMPPLMGFVGNFGYVCVCIVGSILVINGNITIGVIVSFMMYVRLFSNPLSRISQSLGQLQSTVAASERVFELIDEVELESETHKTKSLDVNKVKGQIEFNDVKFSYNKDKEIIKEFNVKCAPGTKIALVGPTGSGKTTMVNLLMRFYELNSGNIKIDDVDIKDITRENVHDLFCMVLQDTWIFEGTIKENIVYNKENVTDEEIVRVCKKVGLDHFIRSLPKGYDTILNDAESLSSGQKQLLTIARAMIKNSPFLILDEATSSVDTRTEKLVSDSIDELTKNKTSFIIAHRLSTIKNADTIIVMKEGSIVEIGSHKELLEQNGFYSELYNSQFQDN